MKTMLLIFLMMSSLLVFAEEENCDPTPTGVKPLLAVANAVNAADCPNKNKLKNLCMMVNNRTPNSDPANKNQYMYQKLIMEASCVTDGDSPQEINKKIRNTWAQYEDELTCSSVQFDVPKGSIIKYAVKSAFDVFLTNVIQWEVNLNRVDPSDQRTVLDYVKYHLDRNKGNALEQKFKIYYDRLRAAGAKHKSEL